MSDIRYLTPERLKDEKPIWVNPIGGLGDVLMLSTALKASFDKYGRKFFLVRRSRYSEFFRHHPAIEEIGHPERDADIISNDYWSREDFQDANNKAMDINLKIFGVEDKIDSLFWAVPEMDERTKILLEEIPWREKTVIISISSDGPRKVMHPIKWHIITQALLEEGCFVVQVGSQNEIPIKGAYNLTGATTPSQLYHLLRKADLVITHDNFIMHAAKEANAPTIAIFGPTESSRYGYEGHQIIQNDISDCPDCDKCLGPHVSENYSTPCPMRENHCMNKTNEGKVIDIALNILNNQNA